MQARACTWLSKSLQRLLALPLVVIACTTTAGGASLEARTQLQVARGSTSTDASQAGRPYDLHLLVRSWSPGYCSSTHCTARPMCAAGEAPGAPLLHALLPRPLPHRHAHCSSAFTIHGLWPEFSNGSWPEYCHGGELRGTFTPGQSTTLDGPHNGGSTPAAAPATAAAAAAGDTAMACEWPSFSGTDAAFHEHEWSRHGTCAAAALGGNRQAFYQTVLALNRKYDLNVRLLSFPLTLPKCFN